MPFGDHAVWYVVQVAQSVLYCVLCMLFFNVHLCALHIVCRILYMTLTFFLCMYLILLHLYIGICFMCLCQ